MKRYIRQTILEEIKPAGQEKLAQSAVLVIGAGGLGCPALQYLTAAGIGHIGITDFDRVDESNLQRQILFDTQQIGQNKARAAKEKLAALNPDIQISAFEKRLDEENAKTLFASFDLIIDATDNFRAKYLIHETGLRQNKVTIYGAIDQFKGQISVFDPKSGPCYRCLYPEKPNQDPPPAHQRGVIGPVPGIIGTLQAMETIKCLIKHKTFKPLIGVLYEIDLRTLHTRTFHLPKDEHCPACGA